MKTQEIRDRMSKIKSDISRKEGERSAVLGDLKKEFDIDNLDKAYDLFDSLKAESESKQKEKSELTTEVEQKLAQYGY